jgi:putative transposase
MFQWPHAPPHFVGPAGVYFVTAGTYQKKHRFRGDDRLRYLHDLLLELAIEFDWSLEAWSVFSNHYHFVARSPTDSGKSLSAFLAKYHGVSARELNRQDSEQGRKVWHNHRESHVITNKSYLARLNYVHSNAVHHGLCKTPSEYPWCSARWFEGCETPARIATIYNFPISRLLEGDDW